MIQLAWSDEALSDLARLYDFLATDAIDAAARTVQGLVSSAESLLQNPRLWERLDAYTPREVRTVILLGGRYEMRYEITSSAITIIRIWSTRENR